MGILELGALALNRRCFGVKAGLAPGRLEGGIRAQVSEEFPKATGNLSFSVVVEST